MILTVKISKEESYKCELREPGFEELAHALMLMTTASGKANTLLGGRFLIESCWVKGDEKIKKDTKLLFSAAFEASKLIEVFETNIKKK